MISDRAQTREASATCTHLVLFPCRPSPPLDRQQLAREYVRYADRIHGADGLDQAYSRMLLRYVAFRFAHLRIGCGRHYPDPCRLVAIAFENKASLSSR